VTRSRRPSSSNGFGIRFARIARASPDHVGPTTVASLYGSETELDVVVAATDAEAASKRTVLAIGEAKAGDNDPDWGEVESVVKQSTG
jgi:hypothetical protein